MRLESAQLSLCLLLFAVFAPGISFGEVNNNQLANAYSTSEFFVSASQYEGFGLTAIDTMAAGLLPVLNDIAAFRNFVEDKRNGVIVNFSDKNKAANDILKTMSLTKKKKELMAKAAKDSVQKFNWEKNIEKFLNVYSQVR